jgi:hypothetical protein
VVDAIIVATCIVSVALLPMKSTESRRMQRNSDGGREMRCSCSYEAETEAKTRFENPRGKMTSPFHAFSQSSAQQAQKHSDGFSSIVTINIVNDDGRAHPRRSVVLHDYSLALLHSANGAYTLPDGARYTKRRKTCHIALIILSWYDKPLICMTYRLLRRSLAARTKLNSAHAA